MECARNTEGNLTLDLVGVRCAVGVSQQRNGHHVSWGQAGDGCSNWMVSDE